MWWDNCFRSSLADIPPHSIFLVYFILYNQNQNNPNRKEIVISRSLFIFLTHRESKKCTIKFLNG